MDCLAYNQAFRASLRQNDWRRVLLCFEHMLDTKAQPVALDSSCSALLVAVGRRPGAAWRHGAEALEGLQRRQVPVGTAACNTLLAAYVRGGAWVGGSELAAGVGFMMYHRYS